MLANDPIDVNYYFKQEKKIENEIYDFIDHVARAEILEDYCRIFPAEARFALKHFKGATRYKDKSKNGFTLTEALSQIDSFWTGLELINGHELGIIGIDIDGFWGRSAYDQIFNHQQALDTIDTIRYASPAYYRIEKQRLIVSAERSFTQQLYAAFGVTGIHIHSQIEILTRFMVPGSAYYDPKTGLTGTYHFPHIRQSPDGLDYAKLRGRVKGYFAPIPHQIATALNKAIELKTGKVVIAKAFQVQKGYDPAIAEVVKEYLPKADPNCSYADWRDLLWSVLTIFGEGNKKDAVQLLDIWSSGGNSYDYDVFRQIIADYDPNRKDKPGLNRFIDLVKKLSLVGEIHLDAKSVTSKIQDQYQQIYESLSSLEFPIAIDQTIEKYIPENALVYAEGKQLCGLIANPGTGKTTAMKVLVTRLVDEGKNVVILTPTRVLGKQIATKGDYKHRWNPKGDERIQVVCVEQFQNRQIPKQDTIIIIDEVQKIICQLIEGNTTKNKTLKTIYNFGEYVRRCIDDGLQLYFMQDGITTLTLRFLQSLVRRGSKEMAEITEIHRYQLDKNKRQRTATIYPDLISFYEKMEEFVNSDQPIFIYCDTKTEVKRLEKHLVTRNQNYIAVHADNITDHIEFINDPDKVIQDKQPLFVIISPVAGYGFSISIDYFKAYFACCQYLTSYDNRQAIERVRQDIPRYIYATEYQQLEVFEDGIIDYDPAVIKERLMKMIPVFMQYQEYIADYLGDREKLHEDVDFVMTSDQFYTDANDPDSVIYCYLNTFAEAKAREAYSRSFMKDCLIEELRKLDHYQIITVDPVERDKEEREDFKELRANLTYQIVEEEATAIVEADHTIYKTLDRIIEVLSEVDGKLIEYKDSPAECERLKRDKMKAKKALLVHQHPVFDFSNLDFVIWFIENKKWIENRAKLNWIVVNPYKWKAYLGSKGYLDYINSARFNNPTEFKEMMTLVAQGKLLEKLPELREFLLDRVKTWDRDTAIVKTLAMRARAIGKELEECFGNLTILEKEGGKCTDQWQSDLRIVNRLVDYFGGMTPVITKRNNKTGYKQYSLNIGRKPITGKMKAEQLQELHLSAIEHNRSMYCLDLLLQSEDQVWERKIRSREGGQAIIEKFQPTEVKGTKLDEGLKAIDSAFKRQHEKERQEEIQKYKERFKELEAITENVAIEI